jgi:hypothetical protein
VHSKGLPGLEGEVRKESLTRNLGDPTESFVLGDRERSHGRAMSKGMKQRKSEIHN